MRAMRAIKATRLRLSGLITSQRSLGVEEIIKTMARRLSRRSLRKPSRRSLRKLSRRSLRKPSRKSLKRLSRRSLRAEEIIEIARILNLRVEEIIKIIKKVY